MIVISTQPKTFLIFKDAEKYPGLIDGLLNAIPARHRSGHGSNSFEYSGDSVGIEVLKNDGIDLVGAPFEIKAVNNA